MANLTGAYDANAEAQQQFDPLPTGDYHAQIVDSDMKPTKKNDGHFLELEYDVIDGPCKGRKVWVRLNLDNPNAKAVEIANRQFASIREATGVMSPRDSQELHYKPHVIRVDFTPAGTKRRNGTVTDRDSNEVKAWKRLDGDAPAAAPAAAAQAASAAPWAKRNAA